MRCGRPLLADRAERFADEVIRFLPPDPARWTQRIIDQAEDVIEALSLEGRVQAERIFARVDFMAAVHLSRFLQRARPLTPGLDEVWALAAPAPQFPRSDREGPARVMLTKLTRIVVFAAEPGVLTLFAAEPLLADAEWVVRDQLAVQTLDPESLQPDSVIQSSGEEAKLASALHAGRVLGLLDGLIEDLEDHCERSRFAGALLSREQAIALQFVDAQSSLLAVETLLSRIDESDASVTFAMVSATLDEATRGIIRLVDTICALTAGGLNSRARTRFELILTIAHYLPSAAACDAQWVNPDRSPTLLCI